jgi:hypothetical protein
MVQSRYVPERTSPGAINISPAPGSSMGYDIGSTRPSVVIAARSILYVLPQGSPARQSRTGVELIFVTVKAMAGSPSTDAGRPVTAIRVSDGPRATAAAQSSSGLSNGPNAGPRGIAGGCSSGGAQAVVHASGKRKKQRRTFATIHERRPRSEYDFEYGSEYDANGHPMPHSTPRDLFRPGEPVYISRVPGQVSAIAGNFVFYDRILL